jgi:periplasmic protein TonB
MIAARGPLWAKPDELTDESLSLGRAALIALVLECALPLLVLGVDWSFLHLPEETVVPVMSVRLEQPPREQVPPPPSRKKKPIERSQPQKKRRPLLPIELPKPLPDEVPSKIVLPKLEPIVELVPKEEKKPEPEPELPPLPSVFRDVKPVKKVKPVYPSEAEAQHVQGRVKVRLTVSIEGLVTDVQILMADPVGVFDEAVLLAVRQYVFKKDGTRYQADQEIVFKIDE